MAFMYNLTKDKTLSAFYNRERTLKKEIHCRDDVKNKCFAYPIQEKNLYKKKEQEQKIGEEITMSAILLLLLFFSCHHTADAGCCRLLMLFMPIRECTTSSCNNIAIYKIIINSNINMLQVSAFFFILSSLL